MCALTPTVDPGHYSFLQSPFLSAEYDITASFWLKGTVAESFPVFWTTQDGSRVGSTNLAVTTSWERFTLTLPALGKDALAALTFADGTNITTNDYFGRVGLRDLQISNTFTPGSAGVPEPDTYLMLIAGFGLFGAMLRRHRLLQTA